MLGKQSQNFLSVRELLDFLNCVLNVPVASTLILEVCQPSDSGVIEFDAMTPNCLPNGLRIGMQLLSQNSVTQQSTLALVAKDRTGASRQLFEYQWTLYSPHHLSMAVQLLDPAIGATVSYQDWENNEWTSKPDEESVYDDGGIMWFRVENRLAVAARNAALISKTEEEETT